MTHECFYCGALISKTTGKGDHFPVPRRHGGEDTVPCCVSCHDMKDRFTLSKWPSAWMSIVVSDIPNMRRETRLFLAKAMALCIDAERVLEEKKT